MKRALPWIALGLVVGSVVWAALRQPSRSRLVGAPMPALKVSPLRDEARTLERWSGRVSVVNVWASWCGPCVQEMPSLQRLHEKLGAQGLNVVGISVDESAADAEAFVHSSGVTFPQFHDRNGRTVFAPLDVDSLPTTFIVGKDGRIVDVLAGLAEYDTPEAIDHFRELLRR